MSRLAGFPTGLLDLVGSQSFGTNPRDLSDIVAPTIDLSALYLAHKQRLEPRSSFVVATGNNTANAILVPQGEIWRVHFGSLFCGTGVGETMNATMSYTQDGTTIGIANTVFLGASASSWSQMSAEPFWAIAGSRLSLFATGVTGVPTASGGWLVSKLKA